MKKFIASQGKIIGAMMLMLGLVATPLVLTPATVSAAPACSGTACISDGAGDTGLTGSPSVETTIKNVTNILLFLIGAVSVIMLIIGGFKYVTSNGNADQIKSAKNTIMYSVIGLVVAILAYAIVDWVVDSLT